MAEGHREVPPVSPVVPYSLQWFVETVYREGGTLQSGRNGELTAAYPSNWTAVVAIRASFGGSDQILPTQGMDYPSSQD